MVATLLGPIEWSLERDSEGHRNYTLRNRVRAAFTDGPLTILLAPGLPVIGAPWAYGSEYDYAAFCHPDVKVEMQLKEEKNQHWIVTNTFSTKPLKTCTDNSIDDPLMQPQEISGSFTKYVKEATKDRNGKPILSTSFEPLKGPGVEFDANRPAVRISQNVANLGLAQAASMVDTVNQNAMWGVRARCVKLSNFAWERKLHGTCNFYYNRTFDFDIDYNTFDRDVINEGSKVLHGRWKLAKDPGEEDVAVPDEWILVNINGKPPNVKRPTHYMRFVDRYENPCRTLLKKNGKPVIDEKDITYIHVEKYDESNFFLLGIPAGF